MIRIAGTSVTISSNSKAALFKWANVYQFVHVYIIPQGVFETWVLSIGAAMTGNSLSITSHYGQENSFTITACDKRLYERINGLQIPRREVMESELPVIAVSCLKNRLLYNRLVAWVKNRKPIHA